MRNLSIGSSRYLSAFYIVLQLHLVPFQYLIITLNESRFSKDFICSGELFQTFNPKTPKLLVTKVAWKCFRILKLNLYFSSTSLLNIQTKGQWSKLVLVSSKLRNWLSLIKVFNWFAADLQIRLQNITPFVFYKQSIFDPGPKNCLSFSKKSSPKIA